VSDIFRDPTEGALARRLDLLRRRRDELITMPHAVRRVVVARSARITASLVLCLGGVVMLVAAVSPVVSGWLQHVLPGRVPAVISQLLLGTWALAVFAYALSRSRAEHRFIVAMSRYVLPGDDLSYDLERLSREHPDAMAQQMAHRLEVRSTALPVLAAALVLPPAALYIIDSVRELGWASAFDASIEAQAWGLVGCAVLGLAGGIAVSRRAARAPAVGPMAGALAAMALAAVQVVVVSTQAAPPIWLLAPVAIASTFAIVARRLRIEREWIDATDLAAGSEQLTLRDVIAAARRAYGFLRARVRRSTVGLAAGAVLLVAAALSPSALQSASQRMPRLQVAPAGTQAAFEPSVAPPQAPVTLDESPGYRVESIGAGQVRMTVELEAGAVVDIPGLAGLDEVPAEWRARIVVRLAGSAPGPVEVTSFVGDAKTTLEDQADAVISTIVVCGPHPGKLGLRVGAPGDWPAGRHAVALIVEPQLALSPCPLSARP
jgi:hypothetical protein